MAASLSRAACGTMLKSFVKPGAVWSTRGLHVTAVPCKNFAARTRVAKGNKPVTYERAMNPHDIGHRKGWLSQHPCNLKGEEGAADRTMEDTFIRRFIAGTFHDLLANEVVIKRRGNVVTLCAILVQKLPPQKYYFLIGYTETLLAHFYKCPVKLDIQMLPEKTIYKYV